MVKGQKVQLSQHGIKMYPICSLNVRSWP